MIQIPFMQLPAYLLAKKVAVQVQRARIQDSELRDQATRAAKSCFLNLAEGLPSYQAGIRKRHFAIAIGSIAEVAAAIDLAVALGVVDSNLGSSLLEDANDLSRQLRALSR